MTDNYLRARYEDITKVILAERESQRKKVIAEVESSLVEVVNKKFPRGERKWCIECADRITEELRAKVQEMKEGK